MPGELKQMIDKNDQNQSRQVTRELHTATSQLGKHKKALQDIVDARLNHRAAWYKYVVDCAETWQKQLTSFETQDASLKELEQKTKQEIVACSETIKALSHAQAQELPAQDENAAADVSMQAQPVGAQISPQTTVQFSEAELKDMQKKATQALQSCVAGLTKVKEEAKELPPDVQVVSSGDERPSRSRSRSKSKEPEGVKSS